MGSFPTPRPFQDTAHEALREGYKNKHRRQVISAPTGSGKTVLGLRVIKEAMDRQKFCGFLCDRKTLIDQTSSTADRYGLSHGIMQADHWRTDKSQNFQVISVQTMERRKWPIFDVLVIDECHTLRKRWIEFVQENPKMAVIGLTATPFAKGMGKIFSNLINAATMHELTEQGILVPMRVFSGRQIDMKGAKKVAGEWSDKDVEERGREIIGDVVTEWFKHGDNRKTIVFGATIAHCEEMCKAFNEAGVMAAVFTSKTPDEERTEILDLYSQDDTPLRVLVSVEALCLDSETEILTRRGWATINDISEDDLVASFDMKTDDIEFKAPIQVIKRPRGNGERMVCRDSKLVSIRVTEGHRMIVPRGSRGDGGHPLGWQLRAARDCAGKHGMAAPAAGFASPELLEVEQEARDIPIARRMSANAYVLRQGGMSPGEAREEAMRRINRRVALRHKSPHELSLDECRLIGFWIGDGSTTRLSSGGITYKFAQSMRYLPIVDWFDALLARLGLAASRAVIPKERVSKATADVVTWNVPRGTGFGSQARSGLYAVEPYLKKDGADLLWGLSREQYIALIDGLDKADGVHYRHSSRLDANPRIASASRPLVDLLQAIGTCRGCRVSIGRGAGKKGRTKPLYMMTVNASKRHTESVLARAEIEGDYKKEMVWCVETEAGTIVTRRRGRVTIMGNCKGFDVPDVGVICDARPLSKSLSTAIQMWGRGLRCSPGKQDCKLLDFSGNVIRFREDFEDFYFNGVKSLDDGEKLDKKVREEDERVERSCPKCGYTPFVKRCVACGHENVSVSTIEHLPGELLEIKIGKKTVADNPNHLWAQIAAYVKQAGKPETAFGRACHLYRDVTGRDPERYMSLNSAPIVDISKALIGKIVSRQIAYSKGMQKYQRG